MLVRVREKSLTERPRCETRRKRRKKRRKKRRNRKFICDQKRRARAI